MEQTHTSPADPSPLRADAVGKAAGSALYVDDIRFPGMLYVQAVHSPHAHADILSIDPAAALAAPGVAGVYTAADVTGVNAGPKDKPVLAKSRVLCPGDGVALVAAETRAQAVAAARLVQVRYRALPAVGTVRQALAPGAPALHGGSNKVLEHRVRKGDCAAGLAAADVVIERTYTTQRAMHGALEPDGAIAVPSDGGLVLVCPGKNPFGTKRAVAEACGLPEHRVRVMQPAVGGAFGGKDVDIRLIAARAALVALRTGRPCKCVWSREEVMAEGSKRHPFEMAYTAGVRRDGKVLALRVDALADIGAYLSKSKATVWRAAVEAAGPYDIDHVDIRVAGVFTNNPYSDCVRGLGSPQVDFAMESLMDEIARELGLSPFAIRRLNALQNGGCNATGQRLETVHAIACLNRLEAVFPLDEVAGKPQQAGPVRRGRGIACISRGEARGAASGEPDEATVVVQLEADGGLRVLSGIAEMGQGGAGVVRQVVAKALGLPMEQVAVAPLDTHYVPDSGPTTGSRGTITSGNAARAAALDLRGQMVALLAAHWQVPPGHIRFEKGRVVAAGGPSLCFAEAAGLCLQGRLNLIGRGYFPLPKVWWDHQRHCGDTYFSYTYGACGAEVAVDTRTGKVTVTDLAVVHDVGRVLNRAEVEGQVRGGVSMALGLALLEQVAAADESPTTDNFHRYLMPTIADTPPVRVYTLDIPAASNPLGVKGIGEPSTTLVAPAVANAVYDALGVRLRSLPFSLEAVLGALAPSCKEEQDG